MIAGAFAQASRCACSVRRCATASVLMLSMLVPWESAPGDAEAELQERGEYLLRIAGCAGCHTAEEKDPARLAGGRRLETPFGTFVSPNITPHPESGIGRWSLGDLTRALRSGQSPESVHLYPVFPYTSYSGMADDDIRALMAYLQRVPQVDKRNQPHELPWYLRYRPVLYIWKLLFHSERSFARQDVKTAAWNRGAYLVNVLGHCGECHTPRNIFGALDQSNHLGGNPDGPGGEAVPNITAHPDDGIGDWSAGEMREYLRSGLLPDGDVAGGLMAEVIEESTSHLRDEDVDAIVTYLKTVPALED